MLSRIPDNWNQETIPSRCNGFLVKPSQEEMAENMPSERDVLDDTCSQQSESPPDLSALIRLYGRRWRWGMNTALHLSAEIQPSQQQCAKTVQGKGKPNGWERLYLVVTVGTSRNLNSTISQLWPFSPVLSHSCWRQRQFAEASCVDNNILGITVAIGPLG